MSTELEALGPELRRAVVERWVQLNIAYARARRSLALAQGRADSEGRWHTWETFHEHALAELREGRLDPWMAGLHDPDFDPNSTDTPPNAQGRDA